MERQPFHRWVVLVVLSHEPSPHTQNDVDPRHDMMICAPESLLSFWGEVKQQVLAVRSQLVVLPHLIVGPTHLPALQ